MAYLQLDRLENTRLGPRMHQVQTLPSVTVAFVKELAGDGFSQVEVEFFSKLFHAANSGVTGTLTAIHGTRKHCNGRINKFIHGPDESALDCFLERVLLLR